MIYVNCLSEATSANFWNYYTRSPSLIYNFLIVPYLIFYPRSGRLNFTVPNLKSLLKTRLSDKVNNFIVLNICRIQLIINEVNLYGDIST